jgi:hypothetical protein
MIFALGKIEAVASIPRLLFFNFFENVSLNFWEKDNNGMPIKINNWNVKDLSMLVAVE